MVQMFVFHKTPVFFLHSSEKHVPAGKIITLEAYLVFIKYFQEVLFFFIKITLKINDKFPKSRHISGNSVVKNLHFRSCDDTDCTEQWIDCWKLNSFQRHLKNETAVFHHLAYLHFSPFC